MNALLRVRICYCIAHSNDVSKRSDVCERSANVAHFSYRCERCEHFDACSEFRVLREACEAHSGAHRVARVKQFRLTRAAFDVVEGGSQVVTGHVIPREAPEFLVPVGIQRYMSSAECIAAHVANPHVEAGVREQILCNAYRSKLLYSYVSPSLFVQVKY